MRKIHFIISTLLGLLLLLSACQPSQPTQNAVSLTALFSELSGGVNAKQADAADFSPAQNGDELFVNGQARTGEDGRARLDLSSGTIVRVAPASLFTLESNEPAEGGLVTKIKLELGRIFIILNGGSLDVESPSGVASVRGSYMMVNIDPVTKDVVITCLEGNCTAGGIQFTDGQKITFRFDPATGNYRAPLIEDMDANDFQLWRANVPESLPIVDRALAARPQASSTPTPLPTATATAVPPAIVNECFKLLQPTDAASLPASGLVNFEWEAMEGAEKYRLAIQSASKTLTEAETTHTSLGIFIEIFPLAGTYSWEVTALDASDAVLCTASAFAFTKPESPAQNPQNPPEGSSCTVESAQWTDPNAPCYCDSASSNNPSYCRAVRPTKTPEPTSTPKPTNTPKPTSTPKPTRTPKPTNTPKPTATPTYYPQ
jgi:hypothetical protein